MEVFGSKTSSPSAPFQVVKRPIRQVMIFLGLSATGLRFWEPPFPAVDSGFPCGQLAGTVPDHIGVTAFRMFERRSGRVSSVLRRLGVGIRLYQPPGSNVSNFPYQPFSGFFFYEASSRIHFHSPVRSSPCLWFPSDGTSLGLLVHASHPAVTSDAR